MPRKFGIHGTFVVEKTAIREICKTQLRGNGDIAVSRMSRERRWQSERSSIDSGVAPGSHAILLVQVEMSLEERCFDFERVFGEYSGIFQRPRAFNVIVRPTVQSDIVRVVDYHNVRHESTRKCFFKFGDVLDRKPGIH